MEGITGQKFIPVHMRRVVTISHEHLEIHEGEDFFFDHLKSANSAETLEILVKTSGTRKMMHAYIECSSLLTATWALYEGTTKTYNASNALTIKNRFRDHPNTPASDVLACHTPGGSGDGTKIAGGFCGGGSGPRSPGGTSRSQAELILGVDKYYLLRITSNANSNQLEGLIDFYEHFDGEAPVTTTTTTTTTTSSSTTTTTA
jgi:hypothetical protein